MTEIRPEVVAGVLDGNPLAAEYCTWAERREALRVMALRNIASGRELLDRLGVHADEPLPEEYRRLATRFIRSPNVQDAAFAEAVGMWRQSAAFDAAMRLLVSWWPQAKDKTLGELLQLIPADVAGEVLDHLRRAGFQDLPDVDGGC